MQVTPSRNQLCHLSKIAQSSVTITRDKLLIKDSSSANVAKKVSSSPLFNHIQHIMPKNASLDGHSRTSSRVSVRTWQSRPAAAPSPQSSRGLMGSPAKTKIPVPGYRVAAMQDCIFRGWLWHHVTIRNMESGRGRGGQSTVWTEPGFLNNFTPRDRWPLSRVYLRDKISSLWHLRKKKKRLSHEEWGR